MTFRHTRITRGLVGFIESFSFCMIQCRQGYNLPM